MSFAWRSIRFVADENVDEDIVAGLRLHEPSIDIVTAGEAGLLHQPDRELLAYAAAEGRVLLTHDERTMFNEFAQFLAAGHNSPGVFVLDQQLAIGRAIEAVLFVWEASVPDDWRNQIRYLPL